VPAFLVVDLLSVSIATFSPASSLAFLPFRAVELRFLLRLVEMLPLSKITSCKPRGNTLHIRLCGVEGALYRVKC